jgi:hypothetical protein
MDMKNFAATLLKVIEKSGLPIAEIKRIQSDKGLFAIETSDNSEFLIKIANREAKRETFFLEIDKTERRIHEIYEKYVSSWEYDEILMNNDFDINWLENILDMKDYRKLENIILQYSSRNDELLFTLGFKYAWSLFMECAKDNDSANSAKLNSNTDSA